jgi:hypothetical protein
MCHEGIWGNGGMVPVILGLGIRWDEWSVSCFNPFVFSEYKAGWVTDLVWTLVRRKSIALAGN